MTRDELLQAVRERGVQTIIQEFCVTEDFEDAESLEAVSWKATAILLAETVRRTREAVSGGSQSGPTREI